SVRSRMHSTVFEREAPDPRLVEHALEGSRLATFWLEGLGAPAHPEFTGTGQYDLAVVGGGYTGLWTALQAKQRDPDARVALLEARSIGWAASGRNGGFCEASLTHGEANGRSRFPAEYDRLEELGLQNLDEIESTVTSLGLQCDFERT